MMTTSIALPEDVQAELSGRHKSTVTTVVSLLVGVILLCVLAFVSQRFLVPRSNPSLDMGVRISMLVFGFGAIALRRTRFAKIRLQDIAALQGVSGLLATLQKTTLLVALIGAVVALIGFAATIMSGTAVYTYLAGVVAAAVLLYGYPVRASWEQAVKRYALSQDIDDPSQTNE